MWSFNQNDNQNGNINDIGWSQGRPQQGSE